VGASAVSFGHVYGNGSSGAGDDLVPDQVETATFNDNLICMSVWSCVSADYDCAYDEDYSEPC